MEKLTKENIYIDLRGKSKEELTELWEFLTSNGEKCYRDKEYFLETNTNYRCLHLYYGLWRGYDDDKVGEKTEVTIEQLKEILKPMETLQQKEQRLLRDLEEVRKEIEEENKPRVGDIGLFWDNDSPKKIGVLGRIYDNGKDRYKMNGSTCWRNFEKLPEELQKELSNYLK